MRHIHSNRSTDGKHKATLFHSGRFPITFDVPNLTQNRNVDLKGSFMAGDVFCLQRIATVRGSQSISSRHTRARSRVVEPIAAAFGLYFWIALHFDRRLECVHHRRLANNDRPSSLSVERPSTALPSLILKV
jgi:hypothetical protein